jgi:hypothetical protein
MKKSPKKQRKAGTSLPLDGGEGVKKLRKR